MSDDRPISPARRRLLGAAGPAMAAMAGGALGVPAMAAVAAQQAPASGAFDVQGIYLNNASMHPLPRVTRQAMDAYLDRRSGNGRNPARSPIGEGNPKALFARLINADAKDLAMVPSTSFGESFLISSLGLGRGSRVVTDALHFMGSLYSYGELARDGLDLEVLRPRDNRIPLEDWARAITPGTRLVALSAVSMTTGLAQDLKAICEIAHARGALVYADVIQAAGAVPLDVRDSGVDFCACGSYKWLMADFGTGFLYVRPDRMELLQRSLLGYRQLARYSAHVLPFDTPNAQPFEAAPRDDATGFFEIGTTSLAAQAALIPSLQMILDRGVANIHAQRAPLLDRLQDELPRHGFIPLTPREGATPMVAFARENFAGQYGDRLGEAGITVAVYPHRLRVSPSIYNTMQDIDALIEVLS